MTPTTPLFRLRMRALGALAVCAFAVTSISAFAGQAPRIVANVSLAQTAQIPNSLHPLAQAQFDTGRMAADTRLSGVSIIFNRSAQQEADLQALLKAQQDPASPQFHQWLTPEQFAARFGLAASDLTQVKTWLEQQGFSIDSVARGGTMIRFSGTALEVERTFGTEMHTYSIQGESHFAPSTALSVPAAIAPVVAAVRNLDNFRPRSNRIVSAHPNFTSSISGSVHFAPGDIKTAYDMNSLINGGADGTGQTIVVAGQSSVVLSDIEKFQAASGLTVKDPATLLVPGSGTPTTVSGDESESDLDLEWSSSMAPGANVIFVYTGNSSSFSVFDSLAFAIDEKIGNIISVSYSTCEGQNTASSLQGLDSIVAQSAAQGQTVVAASGDVGSSACYITSTPNAQQPTLTQQEVLSVNYPASSPYVTAIGGTEITAADGVDPVTGNQGANFSTYWASASGSDVITSAKTYIPENAWNDSALDGSLAASGGGVSTVFNIPAWQTGVPGIPSGATKRLVPDVSFYSSPDFPGYLYCTSDTTAWLGASVNGPAQAASCSSTSFRDTVSGGNYLTVAGGTSFATPIFAGMVAILNQKLGYTTGTGVINTQLYAAAATAGTYSAAFHDVTSGTNECPSSLGATFCSSTSGTETNYSAGTGYDEVTGLGSLDLAVLAGDLSTVTQAAGTVTSVSAASASPQINTNDTVTITVVNSAGSGATPTGTVNLSIDGGGTGYSNSGSVATVTLASNGTATYMANFTAAGTHSIVAQYQGDGTHAASTGTVSITVGGASSGKGSFALAATNVTVAQGSTGGSSLTVTPSGGYLGTVTFTLSAPSSLSNACYAVANAVVGGASAVQDTITLYTSAADCTGAAVLKGRHQFTPGMRYKVSTSSAPAKSQGMQRMAFGLATLLMAGVFGWRSRRFRSLAVMAGLAALGLALSACSGTSGNTTGQQLAPKGTYTLTVTGTDTQTAAINANATFNLTVQ